VGVRVARALGRPIVNGIKGIEVADGVLTARRESDAGFDVYQLALPAVVGVKEGINLPRYPTLPGRLRSKKAEIQTIAADAPRGGLAMVRFETPEVELTETEILGSGADAAGPVVDLIYELGLA
jgi:electron transfer flavoprotein beta subunit